MNSEITCPCCASSLTGEQIKSLWASYTAAQRQSFGGRAKVKTRCVKCKRMCQSAREAREHCRVARAAGGAA